MANSKKGVATPPMFWWIIKIACGFLLIAGIFVRYFAYSSIPLFLTSDFIGQGLVVLGGVTHIYHYLLIKKYNALIIVPGSLITKRGLYKYVRHPMYLSDMIMYTGFVFIMPHWITFIILIIAFFSLYKQAKAEDFYMSGLFNKEFKIWADDTKLILPFISM